MSDLLDLQWDTPGPSGATTADVAGRDEAKVAASAAETIEPTNVLAETQEAPVVDNTAAPAEAAVAEVPPAAGASDAEAQGPDRADNAFGEMDDWDAFQSAVPTQVAATAIPAELATAAPATTAQVDAEPAVIEAVAPDLSALSPPRPKDTAPTETSAPGAVGADPLAMANFDQMLTGAAPVAEQQAAAAVTDVLVGAEDPKADQWGSLFDPMAQAEPESQPSVEAATATAEGPAAPEATPQAQQPVQVEPVATSVAPSAQADLLGLDAATAAAAAAAASSVAAVSSSAAAIEPLSADPAEDIGIEDIQKKMIFVYHKGERTVVGWYADTPAKDIKEAILCACDAIMDGGFVLREVQFSGEGDDLAAEPKEDGRVYQYEHFHELQHEQTYILEAAREREELKNITGDRWRRLKIAIDPMLHVEAMKAVDRMRRGSNLLKHTHYGFPHLRQFQLSDDKKRLVWYSGAKRKEDSVIQLEEVQEIRLGQTTQVFLHYRLPMLEHLSFSLVYGRDGSKTLDLTCKDEFEFDHWVTGLKAIFYILKKRNISKEQLLNHSKRFRKALEKNNTGIKLTKLPEVREKGHVGLDDCIEIVTHTPQQLDTKMERLRERLRTMSQQVARLDHHAAAEGEVDLGLLTGSGPAYERVWEEDEDAQDEEMEIRRMHELVEQTTQVLQQAKNELIAIQQRQKQDPGNAEQAAKGKKKESAACKHVDQLLWKAEVDLENVEDMYLRHVDNQKDTSYAFKLADMNQMVSRTYSDLEETFNKKYEEMRSWWGSTQ
mmetsp:Transcript_19584/g.45517  ORF Transcript_19584/g.45517 Transcript_19584/m.45517 type:complete len:777 (-) Transcript_19584:177-2507(-)